MKRVFKILFKIIIILIILMLLNCLIHQILLKTEESKISPNGTIVNVNGHKMHVYSDGTANDNPVLIFLAGSATVAPVYDFKSIYSKLSDSYRIAVVEKAGYGYSEECEIPRDVETMVEETRQALKLADIQGKYILLPHSMSGLEALYWAKKYPDEVEGIIGLDMALPDHYNNFDYARVKRLFTLAKPVKFIGLHRTFAFLYSLNETSLTQQEIAQQKYLMFKNAANQIFYTEGTYTQENATKIKELGVPTKIDIMLFLSDGTQTDENWIPISEEYAQAINAPIVYLDCGHYIHYYKSKTIAENIIEFLNQNISN